MSTFLQLCADLARESGAVGAAPTTVTGQTGRLAKVVAWVADAWTQIQADNPNWNFLRSEFSGTLAINTMAYTPDALNITDFTRWVEETPDYRPVSIYPSGEPENEVALLFTPYEAWRTQYYRGTHDAQRPVYWSVSPARELVVGPKPDAAYVIRGEYQAAPQILAVDGDIPNMPTQYHQAILWRAAMMLAEHDEAPSALQVAARKYQGVLYNMERDLLPAITLDGSAIG